MRERGSGGSGGEGGSFTGRDFFRLSVRNFAVVLPLE